MFDTLWANRLRVYDEFFCAGWPIEKIAQFLGTSPGVVKEILESVEKEYRDGENPIPTIPQKTFSAENRRWNGQR